MSYFLSEPRNGYVDVNIPNGDNNVRLQFTVSNICDDSIDYRFVKKMLDAINYKVDFSVSFAFDDGFAKIISDEFGTYIIVGRDNFETYHAEINKFDLAKLLYYNVADNLDKWAAWPPYPEMEYGGMYAGELNHLIQSEKSRLNMLLNEFRGCLAKNHCL